MIEYADALGYAVIDIATNAHIDVIKSNKRVFDVVAESSALIRFSTSLDSHVLSVNEKFREGHSKVIKGIKYLVDLGYPPSVGVVVTKVNYQLLEDLIKFLVGLGIRHIQINTLIPTSEELHNVGIYGVELPDAISKCKELKKEMEIE